MVAAEERAALKARNIHLYAKTAFQPAAHVECEAPVKIGGQVAFKGSIGAYTYVRQGCRLAPGLRSIGRYCSIAPGVLIGDGNHPTDWLSTHPFQWGATPLVDQDEDRTYIRYKREKASITIGHDVWIGTNVIITPGKKIGDGAIVAAGSVVTKDVEPYTIVGGVPARPIRKRFDFRLIRAISALEWWRYDANSLLGVSFNDPWRAVREIRGRIRSGTLVEIPREIVTVGPGGVIL